MRDIGKPKALEVWICRAYLVRRMSLWDRIRGTSLVITGILRWARIRGTYLLAYGCTILSSDPRYVLTYSSKIVSSDPRYVLTYLLVYYPEPTSGVLTYLLLKFLASPVFTFCFWTEPWSALFHPAIVNPSAFLYTPWSACGWKACRPPFETHPARPPIELVTFHLTTSSSTSLSHKPRRNWNFSPEGSFSRSKALLLIKSVDANPPSCSQSVRNLRTSKWLRLPSRYCEGRFGWWVLREHAALWAFCLARASGW